MAVTALVATAPARADESGLAQAIAASYLRTMAHWHVDYHAQDTEKAGTACIDWQTLDREFLESGLFDALGYSYSLANTAMAVKIAGEGCKGMARKLRLKGCECVTVMVDEDVAVEIPPEVAARLGE